MRAAWIIGGSTLLVLVFLELAVRAFRGEIRVRSEFAARGPDEVPYDLHPYLQSVHRSPWLDGNPEVLPGWWVVPEGRAFEPGRRRIFFIGGSTTATMYPEYVRLGVGAVKGETSAFIVAHDFHGTVHSLLKFWLYADRIRPDLVVVLDNVNDLVRGFTPPDIALEKFQPDYSHFSGTLHPFWRRGHSRLDGASVFYARPHEAYGLFDHRDETVRGLWSALRNESALLRLVREEVPTPIQRPTVRQPMSDEVMLRALPSFEGNLRCLARSAQAEGIPIVFLTMPFTMASGSNFRPPVRTMTNDDVHFPDDDSFARALHAFNDAVRRLDGYAGAHVVDLEPAVVDPALFIDEVHLHDAGLKVEAKVVTRFLLEKDLLAVRKR